MATCFVFPQGRNVTQYQFVDDFSLTKGAHNLKFGANFRRYDITDYTFSILNNPLAVIAGPTAMTQFFNGNAASFCRTSPAEPPNRSPCGASEFMPRMNGELTRA